jgi:hypothetical protein
LDFLWTQNFLKGRGLDQTDPLEVGPDPDPGQLFFEKTILTI